METRTDLPKNYVQKNKEDWWLCKCGKHHKGFPYQCPESEEINQEEFRKQIKGKKIVFHDDFELGMRLWLCLNCGFPSIFMGLADEVRCECEKNKPKIYSMDKLSDFILKLQSIHFYNKKGEDK